MKDTKNYLSDMLKDKKNRTKLIIMGGILILCLPLLLLNNNKEKYTEVGTIASNLPESDGFNEWDKFEKESRIISDEETDTELSELTPQPISKTDTMTTGLSKYPTPSFVSENGDSLVYRGAIYKRTGFVEIIPSPDDTIDIDGIQYVKINR